MDVTHEVFNQPAPLTGYNLFSGNQPLQAALKFNAPQLDTAELATLGEQLGSEAMQTHARLANIHTPELLTHDRFGRRVDQVEFHPSYHALMTLATGAGLHGVTDTISGLEHGVTERRRCARAEEARLVDQGADGLPEERLHLGPDRDTGVGDVRLGDRHDGGDLLGDEVDVVPLGSGRLLQPGVTGYPVGGRQHGQHGLTCGAGGHGDPTCQRQRRGRLRGLLDDGGDHRLRDERVGVGSEGARTGDCRVVHDHDGSFRLAHAGG